MKRNGIWLKDGDRNLTYFHKQTITRRDYNSIWKIKDHHGNSCKNLTTISEVGSHYYHSIYNQDQGLKLKRILSVEATFFSWIPKENNLELMDLDTNVELKKTLI
jgi:hypothetical protein